MPALVIPPTDWPELIRTAFDAYGETLLRDVADELVKPRNKLPREEIIEKCVATLSNPPVLDRRLQELPPVAKAVIAIVGRSRQPVWKAGHLMTMAAALGHAEGTATVFNLLNSGLMIPVVRETTLPLADWPSWYASAGGIRAMVALPPSVTLRARAITLSLDCPEVVPFTAESSEPDGLDWPLRLAALWQRVSEEPVRTTQAGLLFKKDKARFDADEIVANPFGMSTLTDAGLFTLAFADAAGLIAKEEDRSVAQAFPSEWQGDRLGLLVHLCASLFHIETTDPVAGVPPETMALSPFPTAMLLALSVLSTLPEGKATTPKAIATWLWERHPGWQAVLPQGAQKDQGTPWVSSVFRTIGEPLRLVEWSASGDAIRMGPLGRHLFHDAPPPPAEAPFPQTLLVQPNAEILAYRQGLSPSLIAALSRFAKWKHVGPACTLELTQEQSYRGLESGLTAAEILQTLSRHSTRPVPPAVDDLLRRWATKRERVTVYASATLVEFATNADLDSALSRGIVSIRLTDRIGLTADGAEPDYKHLRLTGNRDYESRPVPCMTVEQDGVTLDIDVAQADLLLEVELAKIAEPITTDPPNIRRVMLVPPKVRQATVDGSTLEVWDEWFQLRTSKPMPSAAKLFAFGPDSRPSPANKLIVIRFSNADIADGACQWPKSADYISDRLGPLAVAIDAEDLAPFVAVLAEVGVTIEGTEFN